MTDENLKYKIGISLIPGVGPVTAKKLIAYTGSVENVFSEKKSQLTKIPGIGNLIANEIINQKILQRAELEIEFIEKHNITPLFYLDKEYPQRLLNCDDSPVMLFAKGHTDFNIAKIVSIVGTRNATQNGKDWCDQFVGRLVEKKHHALIVSGLAYGIDIAAHKAALKYNLPTVAVLGHGLDKVYPAVHRSAAVEIVKTGALLTEFLSHAPVDPKYFLQRNRIVAGMADVTIVVESGVKGGALVTADIASGYNKEVMAVPGRINDKYSAGCNWLIKTNKAAMIECLEDLEYLLNWDVATKTPQVQQNLLFTNLTADEELIIAQLKNNDELFIDHLALECNLPVSKISAALLNLEFAGLIKSLPGKMYRLK